jgi:holin-like protein
VLHAVTLLLVCQLAGELLVVALGLPLPGPVLGLMLLLAGLLLRGGVPEGLATVARTLLQHLSLLFVPAGVGIMLHLARLQAEWPAIVVALLLSTWLTLLVTVAVMRLASRWLGEG